MIRLGFVGVGWIGRNRMEAMLATGSAEAIAICDPNPDMAQDAAKLAAGAAILNAELLVALGHLK